MRCKHYLPFESRCRDCLEEALNREQARHLPHPPAERRASLFAGLPIPAAPLLPVLGKAR